MIIKIISMSHDMVGNSATIRAEIHEQLIGFTRMKDLIEVEIAGGARMTDEEINKKIKEVYHG